MKRYYSIFALGAFLIILSSCALFNKAKDTMLYSNHNRMKVKVRKNILSSKGILASKKNVSFGDFVTTTLKEGIEDSRIKSFPAQEQPFHFMLNEGDINKIKVEAVYTEKSSFPNMFLPVSFSQSAVTKIFYAQLGRIGAADSSDWQLILKNPSYEDMAKKEIVGILKSQAEEIRIAASNRSGSTDNYDGLTYEFQLDGLPIAAVQAEGKRKYIWMQPDIKEELKYVVSGAIAAILLQ